MSLEQLYTEDFSEDDSSDASFNIDEQTYSSEVEPEEDVEESGETSFAESSSSVALAESEERKRKVDELWEDMNAPTHKKKSAVELPSFEAGGSDKDKQKVAYPEPFFEQEQEGKESEVESALESRDANLSTNDEKSNTPDQLESTEIDGRPEGTPFLSDLNKSSIDQNNLGDKTATAEIKRPGPARKPSKFSQIEASVQQSLGKKLNTVEQSKLQWDKYTQKEDIEHILDSHAKDGYIEKREFLDRADQKRQGYISNLKK